MNALQPSAAEERAMALADRTDGWRDDGLITAGEAKTIDAALAVPWRSHGLVASLVFFFLTSLAVEFTYFLFDLLHIPGGFVTLIAIAAAEALIIGQRWFGTGVESALWIGGLLAFIFSLPSSGKPEALLVFTAAFLIAGIRVRNVLFLTIAAIIVIAYFGARNWPMVALVGGVGAGLAALVASSREWRRPSTELLWDALLVLMPVAGLVSHAVALGTLAPSLALIYAVLAIAALRVAIVTRDHAPLIAAFVDLCAVYSILESNHLLPWKVELRAIVSGIVMLSAAAALNRVLHGRTRGITATPVRLGELEELTQLAGAMHVQQQHAQSAPAEPQPVTGGGSFGGAGTTGDY